MQEVNATGGRRSYGREKLAAWARFKAALLRFREREGHCRVPQRHKERSYNLGSSVADVRCRQTHIKGRPERVAWLKSVGFVFTRQAQNAPPYASRIRWEVDLHHAGWYGHEKHANRPLSLSRIELRWDPKRTQPRFGITFT